MTEPTYQEIADALYPIIDARITAYLDQDLATPELVKRVEAAVDQVFEQRIREVIEKRVNQAIQCKQ